MTAAAPTRMLTVANGRRVALAEVGAGPPLLYLHDFIDIHGSTAEWLPFHLALAERFRVIAPAFPGCAGSDDDPQAFGPDDALFHVLEVLDALALESVPVVGTGIGGWIAAELASRCRRSVERLVLIGANGLFVPDEPTADVFYEAQPINGTDNSPLRRVLFTAADAAPALEWVPDARQSTEREMLRFGVFRFATRIGFKPPYLYDRRLAERLGRYDRPALIIWGAGDGMVSLEHGRTYERRLPRARLCVFDDAGHSVHVERGTDVAHEVLSFLG